MLNAALNCNVVDPKPFADQLAAELKHPGSMIAPKEEWVLVAGPGAAAGRPLSEARRPESISPTEREQIGTALQQVIDAFNNKSVRVRIGGVGSDDELGIEINRLSADFNRNMWTPAHQEQLREIQRQLNIQ